MISVADASIGQTPTGKPNLNYYLRLQSSASSSISTRGQRRWLRCRAGALAALLLAGGGESWAGMLSVPSRACRSGSMLAI